MADTRSSVSPDTPRARRSQEVPAALGVHLLVAVSHRPEGLGHHSPSARLPMPNPLAFLPSEVICLPSVMLNTTHPFTTLHRPTTKDATHSSRLPRLCLETSAFAPTRNPPLASSQPPSVNTSSAALVLDRRCPSVLLHHHPLLVLAPLRTHLDLHLGQPSDCLHPSSLRSIIAS